MRKGFSLPEAIMAIVVLGIATAGVLVPFTSGARLQVEGVRRTMAAKLAGDLMEEIIMTPFGQVVSTYNGYSEPQGQVKDVEGNVFTDPGYAGFARSASCQYVYVPQEAEDTASQFVMVSVTVSYGGRELAVLNRLMSK